MEELNTGATSTVTTGSSGDACSFLLEHPTSKRITASIESTSREATAAPQTGAQRERGSAKHKEWSLTRHLSERISKHSLRLTTPSAPFSERDHFLMARPPLLGKEGKTRSLKSTAASRLHTPRAG